VHSQTLYPARGDYARTQCRTRIRFTCKRKSWAAERSLFAGSLDLDQGFANNGVVVRGPFFRWRLDTHRIYILLLLLGKRSSAERLFNTTRSLARSLARSSSGLFYDHGTPREQRDRLLSPLPSSSPSARLVALRYTSPNLYTLTGSMYSDKNWSTTRAARVGGCNCKWSSCREIVIRRTRRYPLFAAGERGLSMSMAFPPKSILLSSWLYTWRNRVSGVLMIGVSSRSRNSRNLVLILSWIKTRSKQEIRNWFQDKTRNCYQDKDFLDIKSRNFLKVIVFIFNTLLF